MGSSSHGNQRASARRLRGDDEDRRGDSKAALLEGFQRDSDRRRLRIRHSRYRIVELHREARGDETGQEVDRSDINLRGDLAAQAEILRKAFTLDELEAMDAKIEAAKNGPKVVEAPAVDQAGREVVPSVPKAPSSWRD